MMSGHFRSRYSPARSKSRGLIGVAAVFAALAALLYATVLAAPAGARRQSGPSRRALAARLLKLDPGRRLGGDTIVGVSNGDVLLGAANRVNFMVALGSGETVVGGNRADQLGALGKNATIHGGAGKDAIHGGPGHDVISGGAGNDLITDTEGSATINTGAGKNEVEVAGHPGRDRVLCAPGSVDRIYANRGDYVAPSCRKASGSLVAYHQPPSTKPPTAEHNGCTDNPSRDCTFLAAAGSLPGFWWSQKLPQRQCPPSHPYLLFRGVPDFLNIPFGVEVSNIPQVDYLATRLFTSEHDPVTGVRDGSVTNWTFSSQEWRMWFHCTSDKSQAWCHKVCRG